MTNLESTQLLGEACVVVVEEVGLLMRGDREMLANNGIVVG